MSKGLFARLYRLIPLGKSSLFVAGFLLFCGSIVNLFSIPASAQLVTYILLVHGRCQQAPQHKYGVF
jgi:hypothetical protein